MSQFFTQPVIKTKKSSTVRQNKNVSAVDVTRKALQEMGFMNKSSELNVVLGTGTTSERSVVPVAGEARYNTTLAAVEVYNGSTWVQLANVSDYTEYTINLTNANLKALISSPTAVLAAAGSGLTWNIQSATITYNYAGAAFTNANTFDVCLKDTVTGGVLLSADSYFFTTTSKKYAVLAPNKGYHTASNSAVTISATGSNDMLVGGTSTAVLKVTAKKVAI